MEVTDVDKTFAIGHADVARPRWCRARSRRRRRCRSLKAGWFCKKRWTWRWQGLTIDKTCAIGDADVARALVPRAVTAALALPIAEGLGAPLAVTAAAVVCTGERPNGSVFLGRTRSLVDVLAACCSGASSADARFGHGRHSVRLRHPPGFGHEPTFTVIAIIAGMSNADGMARPLLDSTDCANPLAHCCFLSHMADSH